MLLSRMPRAQASTDENEPIPQPYREGAVLVGLRGGGNGAAQQAMLAAPGAALQNTIAPLNLMSLSVTPGLEAATVAALRRRPDVAFAELDYLATAAGVPNDPDWGNQWSLAQDRPARGLERDNGQRRHHHRGGGQRPLLGASRSGRQGLDKPGRDPGQLG